MKEDEEYKMQDLDELYGYMWLKSDVTNINADIFVDDGEAYIRDNHVPLLFVCIAKRGILLPPNITEAITRSTSDQGI